MAAPNTNKSNDVQGGLARDTALGSGTCATSWPSTCRKARARWETRKAWSLTLPLPVWDEHARKSRMTGRSITECLASAVRRDHEQRSYTLERLEALDQNVRALHAAASQLLQEGPASAGAPQSDQRAGMRALPDRECHRGASDSMTYCSEANLGDAIPLIAPPVRLNHAPVRLH